MTRPVCGRAWTASASPPTSTPAARRGPTEPATSRLPERAGRAALGAAPRGPLPTSQEASVDAAGRLGLGGVAPRGVGRRADDAGLPHRAADLAQRRADE